MTDSNATELLQCPMRGSEPEMQHGIGEYWVLCIRCSTSGRMCTTEAKAAEAWNTRTEQAVAATLGTPKLIAEHVREVIAENSFPEQYNLLEFNDSFWQAIADELNAALGDGECENVSDEPQHFQCSECRSRGNIRKVFDNGTRFSFCPDCGAKVKAVKR